MKRVLLILIAVFALSYTASAQTLGVGLQVGVPLNEFADNTDAIGAGIKANLMFPFAPAVPVLLGIEFGYMNYGQNNQQINEQIEVRAGNTVLSRIPINLGVRTSNNLLNGNLVFRVKAPLPMIQPYLDVVGGFNYLWTRTKITDETQGRIFTNDPDNDVINAENQSSSFTFNYGGGVGFMLKLAPNISLDIRGIYLLGGTAEYFDSEQTEDWTINFSGSNPNDFDPNNPNGEDLQLDADAVPKESKTDMFLVNLGVAFSF